MKRSEIIRLIEGLLRLSKEDTYNDFNGHAENLLCNLEEIGMLPPPVNNFYYKKDTEGYKRLIYEFEPE